jgi:hypothetical protein
VFTRCRNRWPCAALPFSTLPSAATDCRSVGISTEILLPLLSFSAEVTAPPTARNRCRPKQKSSSPPPPADEGDVVRVRYDALLNTLRSHIRR